MRRGVRRLTDLRAWQACNAYKQAVYQACSHGPLARDWERRRQLEESVAGPPAHLSEGFGRFSTAELARFAVIARSSLVESRTRLLDAVHEHYLTEVSFLELQELGDIALREVTALLESLQSADDSEEARNPKSRKNSAGQRRRRSSASGDLVPDGTNESTDASTEPRAEVDPAGEPGGEDGEG